jgi:hypothetical protein
MKLADASSAPASSTLRQRLARLAAPAGVALAEAFSRQRPNARVAEAMRLAEARVEILTG